MKMEGMVLRGMTPLFQVFDMPTAIEFYTDVIGFEVVSTSVKVGKHFDWALLRRNEIELMLNTAYEQDQRPPSPEHARIVAHEDASLYFGCPDVEAWYAFLLAKGIAVDKPIVTGYGWKALYVKDPDGYLLCFHWPIKE